MLEKRKQVFNEQHIPTSRAELSKFIGWVNFCSPFILYTSLLMQLLSTENIFEMKQIHKDAITVILKQIKNAPNLYLIDKTQAIVIAVDSSYTGSGSVFYQINEGKKQILHFHSLTFSTIEKKGFGSLQKELLGIIRTLSPTT